MIRLEFFSRNGKKYEKPYFVEKPDIRVDALQDQQSNFDLSEPINASEGDFLWARAEPAGKSIYFGIIGKIVDKKTITCNPLESLLDFEFGATYVSGSSFEEHMKKLITYYVIQDTSKKLSNLVINIRSNTEHLYKPSDPPTATNLLKYLRNGFKKYNVVWEFKEVTLDGKIITEIFAKTKSISIDDSPTDFSEWEIQIKQPNADTPNQLYIFDKTLKNSETPNPRDIWYLTSSNELTKNKDNPNIQLPTASKVFIYDNEQESGEAYDSEKIAKSELTGNAYNHQISFKIWKKTQLLDIESISIGLLITFHLHNDKLDQLKSVVTGIEETEDNHLLLICGNVRNRLIDYMND